MDPLIQGVPPELLGIGAGWAIVAFGVLAFIRGGLYSRKAMEDVLHDRDEWRAESRIKDAQIAEKDEQLRHLKEVGETVKQLARGLQQEIPR